MRLSLLFVGKMLSGNILYVIYAFVIAQSGEAAPCKSYVIVAVTHIKVRSQVGFQGITALCQKAMQLFSMFFVLS